MTSTKARLAVASSRATTLAIAAARALHAGLWLGLLDGHELDQATALYYGSHDRYRARDHNLDGLTPWEAASVSAHFPPTGRVLIPAAGAGREAIALADLGYEAVGYDPSHELVAIGRGIIEGLGTNAVIECVPADVRPWVGAGPFEAILFGWGGISHVRTSSARVELLSSLHDCVGPGAPMLVSFLERPETSRSHATIGAIAESVRRLRGSNETVEVGDVFDGSFDHYFTFAEIASELADAGFATVTANPDPYAHIVAVAT